MHGISFFSVLSWCFFLTSVIGAMILTSWRIPIVRKYRSAIMSVTLSCIFLGIVSGSTPFLLKKLNPDESRLVPLDKLTNTIWSEPIENPQSELSAEELAWTEHYPEKFRYKLRLPFTFKKWITAFEHILVMMDDAGSIRGFDAYSGLNHWSIPLHITELLGFEHQQKRLFILERFSSHESLRITCIDLQTPSAVWQRTIPGASTGGIAFDFDSQSLLVTAGSSGLWALQGKTGEVLWKRPEIYSVVSGIHTGKYWTVFEPEIAKKPGYWNWLDEQTGKTVSRVQHQITGINKTTPLIEATEDSIFALIGSDHLDRLQKPELNRLWSLTLTEPLAKIIPLNADTNNGQFLLIYETHLAELRKMADNSLIWQKKLSDVDPRWVTLTPDRKLFLLPNESNEIQFMNLATGEWQFSAKASEPIQGATFFGDWFYWISENQLWAYQKK